MMMRIVVAGTPVACVGVCTCWDWEIAGVVQACALERVRARAFACVVGRLCRWGSSLLRSFPYFPTSLPRDHSSNTPHYSDPEEHDDNDDNVHYCAHPSVVDIKISPKAPGW
jgi:hypothetical protein